MCVQILIVAKVTERVDRYNRLKGLSSHMHLEKM